MNLRHFIIFAILLAACNSSQATPAALRIAISPDAQPASEAIMACLPITDGQPIQFEVIYPSQVDLSQFDLFFQLGEPREDPNFAGQIASEQIVIALNPAIGIRELSPAQATDLFSGRISNWQELGGPDLPVELWVGPESDEARQAFEASVLLGAPVAGDANVGGDPHQIVDKVATTPGAAGLLPAAWTDARVVRIDLGLELPVLALASHEPKGVARALLGCLQSNQGQSVLSEKYAPLAP